MLVPQSLAYAMLAGLPAQVGLYASILPLLAYALFGTSGTLAVGPVAVISLITAAAVGNLGLTTPTEAIVAAAALAFLSAVMLVLMGVLRLGFLANFRSHPVIAGIITASGILIALSQVRHILGIDAGGHTQPEMLAIGFVESVSVAQTLAAKRRERIDPDQELVGLGASNVASAVSGGFPVTGGFARSVVNFDAGARTPAAGAFTAVGIALGTMFLTPWLFYLPQATLAATIIVAVLGLVDLGVLKGTWSYNRADFAAVAVTILVALGFGVEAGVVAGIALSLASSCGAPVDRIRPSFRTLIRTHMSD